MGKDLGGKVFVVAAAGGAALVALTAKSAWVRHEESRQAQRREAALDEVEELGMGCASSSAVKESLDTPSAPERTTRAEPIQAVPAPSMRPKVSVSAVDKAVLDLKLQRDKVNQSRKRFAGQAERDKQTALELVRHGHKDRAMIVLQRKKLAENSLQSADNQFIQLEDMVMTIESKENEATFLKGLEEGTAQLKMLNDQLKYDDVEKLLQDNQDQIAYQQEIAALVNGKLDNTMDAEIEAELELLQAEMAAEALETAPQVPSEAPNFEQTGTVEPGRADGQRLAG